MPHVFIFFNFADSSPSYQDQRPPPVRPSRSSEQLRRTIAQLAYGTGVADASSPNGIVAASHSRFDEAVLGLSAKRARKPVDSQFPYDLTYRTPSAGKIKAKGKARFAAAAAAADADEAVPTDAARTTPGKKRTRANAAPAQSEAELVEQFQNRYREEFQRLNLNCHPDQLVCDKYIFQAKSLCQSVSKTSSNF